MSFRSLINRINGGQSDAAGVNTADRKLCFVISAPRSGSTWLMRALNQHPEIFCTENRFFGEHYDVVPDADGGQTLRVTLDEYVHWLSQYYEFKTLGHDSVQFREKMEFALMSASLDVSYTQSHKSVLVDKITPYRHTSETVLQKIHQHFPQAKVVQLVRDGRDVLTSGVFDWIARTKTDRSRHAVFVEKRPGAVVERFFDDDDIDQWTDEWIEPIWAFEDLANPPLTIFYEAMKENQESVLKFLLKEIGIEAGAEVIRRCIEGSTFEEMSGGRKAGEGLATAKARKGISGDWKNYFTKRDGELFLDKTGDMLVRMGYEEDTSWVDALPEKLHLTTDMSSPTDESEKAAVDLSPKAPAKQPRIDRDKTPFLRRVFRWLLGVDLDRLDHKLVNIERNQKRFGQRTSNIEVRTATVADRLRQINSQEHDIMKSLDDHSIKSQRVEGRLERIEGDVTRQIERLEGQAEGLHTADERIKKLGERVTEGEEKNAQVQKRLTDQNQRIVGQTEGLRGVDKRIKKLGERVTEGEEKNAQVEKRLADQNQRIVGQTEGLRGVDKRIKKLGERVVESETKHSETFGRLTEDGQRHEALAKRTGDAERRFTYAERRFGQIAARLEVFEKRYGFTDSRIRDMEAFLESLDSNPHAAWIFANRVERMDATLPFFDEHRRKFHLARYQFARGYVQDLVVADVACGTGYGTAILAKRGGASQVIGVDIEPDTIKYAREVHAAKRVTYLCTSGDALGLPDASVDLVVSFETIEHVSDDEALLAEFARVLRPGGRLICSTPNQWPLLVAPYHTREYDRASFEKVLKRGFKILQLYNQNSGSDATFNHEQEAGIVETTSENEALAECYIAVCELR